MPSRPGRLLAIILPCLLLLLVFGSDHRNPFPLFHRPPPRISLEDQIRLSERYYQEFLKEREAASLVLITSKRDFFLPSFNCPHRVERLGVLGDGGKWVCGMDLIAKKNHSVIYSLGIGTESSFEAAVLRRAPGAEIYAYDFAVSALGPEVEDVPDLKRRSHFWPWALGELDAHGESDDPPIYTLETLMALNGHTFIDILKIDIEGDEFATLAQLISSRRSAGLPLPFGQLQLEIHAWEDPPFFEFLEWWEELEGAGLRPFWTEANLVYANIYKKEPALAEYSFINIRGRHELISDRVKEKV